MPTQLSKSKAIEVLQKALDEIPAVREAGSIGSPEFKKWQRDTRVALRYVFGDRSSQMGDFRQISYTPSAGVIGVTRDYRQRLFNSGVDDANATLQSILNEVKNFWEDDPVETPIVTTGRQHSTEVNDKIFVVHGRNDPVRATVTSFLSRIGLDPIVLQDQPNEGRTIIEKFEGYSDVGFAVVLLTPDDIGGLNDSGKSDLNPRPRQNVVLEWGFFLGKLGRHRVAALLQDEIEFPNDYSGVVYIEIDDNEGWKTRLFRELNNAGMPVDHNKL